MAASYTQRKIEARRRIDTMDAVLTEFETRSGADSEEPIPGAGAGNRPRKQSGNIVELYPIKPEPTFVESLKHAATLNELEPLLVRAGGLETDDGRWKPPRWVMDFAGVSARAGKHYEEAFEELPEVIQGWLLFKCEDADPLRVELIGALRQANPAAPEPVLPEVIRESAQHPSWDAFRPRYA